MSKELPPLPENLPHVVRRIRACQGEVAAQVVFEHALNSYARAAIEAQSVQDGWRELMSEALDNALASTVEDGISNDRRNYRRELAQRIKQALNASAPPAPSAPQAEAIAPKDCLWARNGHQQCPPAAQAASTNRPSTDWYKAKIMETLDDDFHIGPAPQAAVVQQESVAADAERWGQRLNDASWAAVDAWTEKIGPLQNNVFNNIKSVVRAAILKYCEGFTNTAPQAKQSLTDVQKQHIANETGAGHSLICLVESYINGLKGE